MSDDNTAATVPDEDAWDSLTKLAREAGWSVVDGEYRAKYTQAEVDELGKQGKAFKDDDGEHYSYPIADKDDLDNAIHAVGRGGADHNKIRKYIIGRAKDLDAEDAIPDNWNADGSLAEEDSATPDAEPTPPPRARERVRKGGRHRSGPPLGREFRRFTAEGLETRQADGGDTLEIRGLFLRYDAPYTVNDMFGAFTETMHRGVLSGVVSRNADVRFLFNHDGPPFARTLNGTLTIEDRDEGGYMVASLDNRRSDARDLAYAIERGDISQMSCGFIVNDDEWSGEDEWGLPDVRDVYGFEELFDVSAVTFPASPTTSLELAYRALNAVPIESRSRVRKLYAVARELREGKVLSAENAQMLQSALEALHEADDVDVDGIVDHVQTLHGSVTRGKAGLAAVLHKANIGQPDEDEPSVAEDPGEGITDGDGTRAEQSQANIRILELEAEQLRLQGAAQRRKHMPTPEAE